MTGLAAACAVAAAALGALATGCGSAPARRAAAAHSTAPAMGPSVPSASSAPARGHADPGLEALLPRHHFVTTDSADWPDLVIADISRVDPDDVADSYPEIPIVGFSGHTDTAGLRRAHEAGFDQVLVKNALQERAPQIVEELIASVE